MLPLHHQGRYCKFRKQNKIIFYFPIICSHEGHRQDSVRVCTENVDHQKICSRQLTTQTLTLQLPSLPSFLTCHRPNRSPSVQAWFLLRVHGRSHNPEDPKRDIHNLWVVHTSRA
jgi:hypothetical protein